MNDTANQNTLQPALATRLADLYRRMEEAYDIVARQLDFSCRGCTDNCCDSYFLHYTRIEWAYLWEGLRQLPPERLAAIRQRAQNFREQAARALAAEERPAIMCPLNEDGMCAVYQHRLMICRLHGVPSSLTYPDGRVQHFPGCDRCQQITAGRSAAPTVERASLLRELVLLEQQMPAGPRPPGGGRVRIKKTIADMICEGSP